MTARSLLKREYSFSERCLNVTLKSNVILSMFPYINLFIVHNGKWFCDDTKLYAHKAFDLISINIKSTFSWA